MHRDGVLPSLQLGVGDDARVGLKVVPVNGQPSALQEGGEHGRHQVRYAGMGEPSPVAVEGTVDRLPIHVQIVRTVRTVSIVSTVFGTVFSTTGTAVKTSARSPQWLEGVGVRVEARALASAGVAAGRREEAAVRLSLCGGGRNAHLGVGGDGVQAKKARPGPLLVLGMPYDERLEDGCHHLRGRVVFRREAVVVDAPKVQRGDDPWQPRPPHIIRPDQPQERELAKEVEEGVAKRGPGDAPPQRAANGRAVGHLWERMGDSMGINGG